MLRHWAWLSLVAVCACSSGGPTTDPPAAAGSIAPRFSEFGGRIVLSWVERDAAGTPSLRFATRDGDAWSAPKTVLRESRLASDWADVPSVVPLGDGALAAHWTVMHDGSRDARDLLVAVSRDGGLTWSPPASPHRDGTASEHGMATLVPTGTNDDFGVCWLDGRGGAQSDYGEGGTSLYWADWEGGGFRPEILLDARVCDCCKTSASRGSSGPLVAYRDRETGERRDIAVVHRSGAGWSAPVSVHQDGWSLVACPTNGPSIVASGAGAAVAWFTGAEAKPSVWTALSKDGGTTFGAPVRLDGGAPVGRVNAAMLADGSTAVVWLERKGDRAEVRVRRVAADGGLTSPVVVGTTSAARTSGYPSIAANGANGALVAWIETGSPGRLRASVVPLR
jgi:hypothetical protein